MAEMKKGTVKWFDSTKGIGFIKTEEGFDLFVHYTGIANQDGTYRILQAEQRVLFEVTDGKRGPQATNVRIMEE